MRAHDPGPTPGGTAPQDPDRSPSCLESSIFKACDIRGVVGPGWDVPQARQIGGALGRLAAMDGQRAFCVGGDFRRSTPRLKQAMIEGLVDSGMDVHDVGQAPTPLVYFAAARLGCPNVAVVTASHNPGRYNGIKFVVSGRPAVPELVARLQQQLDVPSAACRPGRVDVIDLRESYAVGVREQADQFLARRVALPEGRSTGSAERRPWNVVVDTMSGALTRLAPQVLEQSGYQLISLCDFIDPDFSSGAPNPAEDQRLAGLIEEVRRREADVGFAVDGDGDRVIFVDHQGTIVRPEQLAAILVHMCPRPPTVVHDLKCASIVPRAATQTGGRAVMRPSGYGYIKTSMIELAADLGVEVSGHHFFRELGGGDDALFTALVVLGLLRRSGRRLAELVAPIGWPAITPDLRIACSSDAQGLVETIGAACRMPVSRLDGVRADYGDGWALARVSITEASITLRFEGPHWRRVREIVEDFLAAAPRLRDATLLQLKEYGE